MTHSTFTQTGPLPAGAPFGVFSFRMPPRTLPLSFSGRTVNPQVPGLPRVRAKAVSLALAETATQGEPLGRV